MSIQSEVESLVDSLGDLTPTGCVLAAAARELAARIDCPPTTEKGGEVSIAPFVNSLRATIADLVAKGRAVVDDDQEEADDSWAAIAANGGATPIRDAAQPGPQDVRPRGRRGSAPAS